MGVVLLLIAVVVTIGAVIYGATALVDGRDPGLRGVEPDGRAVPLPADRPLTEPDLERVRFDTAVRGYRMDQVDAALARTAYDLGYKEELIRVLGAEVEALWAGRIADAGVLRRARAAALAPGGDTDRGDTDRGDTDRGAADGGGTDRDGVDGAGVDGAGADGAGTDGGVPAAAPAPAPGDGGASAPAGR